MYALVTGGSRGIGRAICVKLAQLGYKVIVNYVSNDEEARKTLELIKENGSEGELLKFDVADYNATEEVAAKKQHREAVLLPDFSAHHLRHTFCTRLCENETNLKVIQSVMGHKDIQTTMDVYAEATEQKKQESFERLAAKLDIF